MVPYDDMDRSGDHPLPTRRKLDKIPDGEPNLYPQVVAGLKKIYKEKIYPLEAKYKFDEFHSPFLRDTDFEAKPMVLLLGQYSTGKTSFIEFMLDQPFPGSRIGPEPTTDRHALPFPPDMHTHPHIMKNKIEIKWAFDSTRVITWYRSTATDCV